MSCCKSNVGSCTGSLTHPENLYQEVKRSLNCLVTQTKSNNKEEWLKSTLNLFEILCVCVCRVVKLWSWRSWERSWCMSSGPRWHLPPSRFVNFIIKNTLFYVKAPHQNVKKDIISSQWQGWINQVLIFLYRILKCAGHCALWFENMFRCVRLNWTALELRKTCFTSTGCVVCRVQTRATLGGFVCLFFLCSDLI